MAIYILIMEWSLCGTFINNWSQVFSRLITLLSLTFVTCILSLSQAQQYLSQPFHFRRVGLIPVKSDLNIQVFKWRWCRPTWFVFLQSSGEAFQFSSQFWLFQRLFLFGSWLMRWLRIHRCEVGGSVEACWDGGSKGDWLIGKVIWRIVVKG